MNEDVQREMQNFIDVHKVRVAFERIRSARAAFQCADMAFQGAYIAGDVPAMVDASIRSSKAAFAYVELSLKK